MTAHPIGVVLCRVGAAVLTVQAIRSLGYSLPGLFFNDQQFLLETLIFSLMSIVPGLAAVGLWVFANRISTVPGHSSTTDSAATISGPDVLRIGMTLLGIFFLVTGLGDAARVEAIQFAMPDMDGEYQSMLDAQAARTLGDRIAYGLQLLFGLVLIVGRDQLSAFFVKVRHAGVDTH